LALPFEKGLNQPSALFFKHARAPFDPMIEPSVIADAEDRFHGPRT